MKSRDYDDLAKEANFEFCMECQRTAFMPTKYWKLSRESCWNKYRIPSNTKGVNPILEYISVDDPDFGDLDALTKQIESGTWKSIDDAENFLSKH